MIYLTWRHKQLITLIMHVHTTSYLIYEHLTLKTKYLEDQVTTGKQSGTLHNIAAEA